MPSSRGWYRLDPGQCRATLQGALPSGEFYLHARVPQLYGPSPLPQRGDTEFCIASDNFTNANARNCRGSQRPALFTAVKPAEGEQGHGHHARGRGRLRSRSGARCRHPAASRRGRLRPRPDRRRARREDRHRDPAIHQREQADRHRRRARGFLHAIDGRGAEARHRLHLVQRHRACGDGRDRHRGRQCGHDTRLVPGRARPLPAPGHYRHAEARYSRLRKPIDANGQTLASGGKPLAWGGATTLCTRAARFELYDHLDCTARGLTQAGFTAVELAGKGTATLRFK